MSNMKSCHVTSCYRPMKSNRFKNDDGRIVRGPSRSIKLSVLYALPSHFKRSLMFCRHSEPGGMNQTECCKSAIIYKCLCKVPR